jgi:hypothetical protein
MCEELVELGNVLCAHFLLFSSDMDIDSLARKLPVIPNDQLAFLA